MALFSCAWQIQSQQNLSLVLNQYCNKNANTCDVGTAPIEALFTCWAFFPHWLSSPAPWIQTVLAQRPQHGKSRHKESVLSCLSMLLAPISSNCPEIFHFSYVVTLKYFLLLNLSESRPLSSKYHFYVNISSFFSLWASLLCRTKYGPFVCICNILH